METTLILVHGYGVTGSLNWDEVSKTLPPYKIVNLPGHGNNETFTMEAARKTVDDAVGKTENAILVGYSMGGAVCLDYLLNNPLNKKKVKGLVLCATAGRFKRIDISKNVEGRLLKTIDVLTRMTKITKIDHVSKQVVDKIPTIVGESLRDLESVSVKTKTESLVELMYFNVVDKLPEIAVPTAIVYTEKDMVVLPEYQQELFSIPLKTVIPLAENHLFLATQPEKMANAIKEGLGFIEVNLNRE